MPRLIRRQLVLLVVLGCCSQAPRSAADSRIAPEISALVSQLFVSWNGEWIHFPEDLHSHERTRSGTVLYLSPTGRAVAVSGYLLENKTVSTFGFSEGDGVVVRSGEWSYVKPVLTVDLRVVHADEVIRVKKNTDRLVLSIRGSRLIAADRKPFGLVTRELSRALVKKLRESFFARACAATAPGDLDACEQRTVPPKPLR